MNLYAYCYGNPTNALDPLGLCSNGSGGGGNDDMWYDKAGAAGDAWDAMNQRLGFHSLVAGLTGVEAGARLGPNMLKHLRDTGHLGEKSATQGARGVAQDVLTAVQWPLMVVGMGGKGGGAAGIADDAFVVRGGLSTPESLAAGSGVIVKANGKLSGVSVNSATGKTVQQLSELVPNNKIGVTTAGAIRRAGGSITPRPTQGNPDHALVGGISAESLSGLLRPVRANPNR